MNKAMLMFQTPGVIEHIYARPGMFVKKGEVLAELDDRNQRYQAEMAKLQYDQAANQRALVERNYNIEKQLREKDLNAPLQFEASRTQFENASMAEQIAHTAYKIAAKALQDTKLRAPFDCVVTKQMKYVGESSTNMLPPDGPTMFEVYDARASELIFHAPESLLGRIQIGDKIDVTVSALGEKFPAKVVRSRTTRAHLWSSRIC
jgi:RND family efflux transporter MFP subunit